MEYTRVTPVTGRSTLVIDGQALVMALGRPTECNTFDDLADRFLKAVLVCGKDYDREMLHLTGTGKLQSSARLEKSVPEGHALIRRVIEDGTVPLPRSRSTFLALDENKADLASFLSEKLLAGAPVNKIIIVSGGFQDEDTVKCSRPNIDVQRQTAL